MRCNLSFGPSEARHYCFGVQQPKIESKSLINSLRTYCQTKTTLKKADEVECWKCGTVVDQKRVLFCRSCNIVQKPRGRADYFEIMGVKKGFDLDGKELTNKFRLLQMQLHPDRFSNRPEEEKSVSAEYSSLLNTAYKRLQSPIERGLYLLELEGFPLEENEVHLDADFFTEIMEINEELESLKNEKDLERFRLINQEKVDELFRKVSRSFQQAEWISARDLMGKLKYYNNIQEKIKEIEREWGIVKD